MTISVVGKRYARALLELASASNAEDRIARDLQDFAKSWVESADLRAVFENPSVSSQQRAAILKDLATGAAMHPQVRDTLLLLADRRRLRHVPEVAEAFAAMNEARSGKVRAEVTTAAPVGSGYLSELERALAKITGKQVVLVHNTDPSLIGGVVTRIGDKVFDGSVKNRLSELKDELLR